MVNKIYCLLKKEKKKDWIEEAYLPLSNKLYNAHIFGAQYACVNPLPNGNKRDKICFMYNITFSSPLILVFEGGFI